MPNIRDRVKAAISGTPTASVGTALSLLTAVTGARSFASAYGADKNNITVVLDDGNNWQTGVANFSFTAGTLTFTAIDASSNNGAAITLTGNATASVEYLSRDHASDWPFMEAIANNSAGSLTSGGFSTVIAPTVVQDTHAGYNASTGIYSVPQTGTYDVLLKFRLADGNQTGKSYGVGVDTSNSDSANFSWFVGAPNRQGAIYRRISVFNAGDQVRAFCYLDGLSTGISSIDLAIVRIR